MNYDDFVGQVQHRARLPSSDEAVNAIRSTLEVFGRRLQGGEAQNLASQLPEEIGRYIPTDEGEAETFSVQEFLERVSESEAVDLPQSVHHVRAVLSVLQDAVSPGEMDDVRAQLSEEWGTLLDSGSEGQAELGT